MTWLITGGAGYIGSHVVRTMLEDGQRVVVLDDLSTGYESRVPEGVDLIVGSVLDRPSLDKVFAEHEVSGVVHIAAKKQVGESVERPLFYYHENVEGLRTLLEAMVAADVRRLVFSSSAAVYGEVDVDLVTEDTPCVPMSPYGETKLLGEWLVRDTARAHGLAYVNLRYFNVAGARSPELADTGAFNLIPMVFERLAAGEAPRVFGDDYPTPDGSCVRDYIHVSDIASAHVAAARRLLDDADTALTLNIGTGRGVSVFEMIDAIRSATGRADVRPEVVGRRAGDPPKVIASAERIRAELGWSATHDTTDMVESAWAGWQHHHAGR
jgi:UDP-glucose 4-epimerase